MEDGRDNNKESDVGNLFGGGTIQYNNNNYYYYYYFYYYYNNDNNPLTTTTTTTTYYYYYYYSILLPLLLLLLWLAGKDNQMEGGLEVEIGSTELDLKEEGVGVEGSSSSS